MDKDHHIRLKEKTVQILIEVNRLRTREATRTREIFAKLMKSKARGIWSYDETILFLAEYYLKNRKQSSQD